MTATTQVTIEEWHEGDWDHPVELRYWAIAVINGVQVTLWFPDPGGGRDRDAFKRALGIAPVKVRDLPVLGDGGDYPQRGHWTSTAVIDGVERSIVAIWSGPNTEPVYYDVDSDYPQA